MVGERMAQDLLSFGVPILVLGDPGQLPPIGSAGFFTKGKPHYMLTEVHRQALGSPVIALATRARKGKPLHLGTYDDSSVIRAVRRTDDYLNFDQVIVGMHRTRHRINDQIRRRLGFRGSAPQAGEKVVCLRNDHKLGLRNGTVWTTLETRSLGDGFIAMTIENEQHVTAEVIAPLDGFSSRTGDGADLPGQPFAFGYALTCHKAQGSQWDSVCVIDESSWFREYPHRWLYTAVTRAARSVCVVI
jgi:exodeoxyribonuclease-5